jgi:hypothetical protein
MEAGRLRIAAEMNRWLATNKSRMTAWSQNQINGPGAC